MLHFGAGQINVGVLRWDEGQLQAVPVKARGAWRAVMARLREKLNILKEDQS